MLHLYDLYRCKAVAGQSDDRIDVFTGRFLGRMVDWYLVGNNRTERSDKAVFKACTAYSVAWLHVR